ncbi:MAG: hypothetical protein K0Q79_826 [Flavipsychrobacter sp.]|jgi:hypothetical protein|nr:hypothetical protein [Flavipsychrobacter sp.]
MKKFSFIAALLCVSFISVAQVYTFKPLYSVKLTYGAGDMDELWFDKKDKVSFRTFTRSG